MGIVKEMKKHLEALSAGSSVGVHRVSDAIKKMVEDTASKEDLGVTIAGDTGTNEYWGHKVSDLQTGITVANNKITGTLKYVDSGQLVTDWGPGYFIAIKFTGLDQAVTSCKVGMTPSVSSGLVELIGDPDMVAIVKVTDKNKQKFTAIVRNANYAETHLYDLSGLTLADPTDSDSEDSGGK